MTKVVMIGAGSAGFCRTLIQDIIWYPALQDIHFVLMDVDPQRLQLVDQVMAQFKKQHNLKCSFSATTDLTAALTDADFAISMIQVGGLEPYNLDISIPLKYGVDQCVGDTMNPGGLFRGLRHVAAFVEMLKAMESVSSPDIIFMNYANPMAINCRAMQKAFPHIASVGLCHGVQHTTGFLAAWLGIPEEEFDALPAGINHMAWFLKLQHKGKDLYPLIWEKLENEGVPNMENYRMEMMKAAGLFMTESSGHLSEYLPYFRHRRDLQDLLGGKGFAGETRCYLTMCEEGLEKYNAEMHAWASGETPVPYDPKARSVEYAAAIMNAKVTGEITQFAGNIANKGFIENLPYDACVEVPVYVDRLGMHGTHIGKLPPVCAALCQSNVSFQELAAEAALTGDRELAYQACLMDPLTSAVLAPHEIRNMMDEMFDAQIQWLPQFQGKTNDAYGARVQRLPNGATSVTQGQTLNTKIGHYD